MRKYLLILLVAVVAVGGCSRCDEKIDPLTDCNSKVGLDTTLKIFNAVLEGRVLGASNFAQQETRTVLSDTIWKGQGMMFAHQNDADSVLWLLEGEPKWRKGDTINILFKDSLLATSIFVRKRVYGEKKKGCTKVLIPFYEVSLRYPAARAYDTLISANYEGFTTDGNKRRTITFLPTNLRRMSLLYLIDTWPKSGEPITYYSLSSWYGGKGIKYFETRYDNNLSKGLQGYVYFIGQDSINIDYAYGTIPQPVFHFYGRRK